MQSGVDATAVGQHPVSEYNPAWKAGFMLIVAASAFVLLNLFAGVVVHTFSAHRNSPDGGSMYMSPAQREWVQTQLMASRAAVPPRLGLRRGPPTHVQHRHHGRRGGQFGRDGGEVGAGGGFPQWGAAGVCESGGDGP